jgi:hypothetical protein
MAVRLLGAAALLLVPADGISTQVFLGEARRKTSEEGLDARTADDPDTHVQGASRPAANLQGEETMSCHAAAGSGDACDKQVIWAMETGIVLHGSWYPGLDTKSRYEDFQEYLHKRHPDMCRKPCTVEQRSIAEEPTATSMQELAGTATTQAEAAKESAIEEAATANAAEAEVARENAIEEMAPGEKATEEVAKESATEEMTTQSATAEKQSMDWGAEPTPAMAALVFGNSLDRNAIQDFCRERAGQAYDFLQIRWCSDTTLNTTLGFIFHPGVGYKGDLHGPFHSSYIGFKHHHGTYSTHAILEQYLNTTAWSMLQANPDLVVVDSSLWDLAVWREQDNITDNAEVPVERVRQWCVHDLPNLLGNVSEVFPTSRIAFRTAPTIMESLLPGHELEKFTRHEIEMLYDCINSSMVEGALFGKYEVIDYHEIMANISARGLPQHRLYRPDGYHPSSYPSALYVNEILRRVGVKPQDIPEPQLEATMSTAHGFDEKRQFEVQRGAVAALGPELSNTRGEKFRVTRAGGYVLIGTPPNIYRKSPAAAELVASARFDRLRYDAECNDLMIRSLTLQGTKVGQGTDGVTKVVFSIRSDAANSSDALGLSIVTVNGTFSNLSADEFSSAVPACTISKQEGDFKLPGRSTYRFRSRAYRADCGFGLGFSGTVHFVTVHFSTVYRGSDLRTGPVYANDISFSISNVGVDAVGLLGTDDHTDKTRAIPGCSKAPPEQTRVYGAKFPKKKKWQQHHR